MSDGAGGWGRERARGRGAYQCSMRERRSEEKVVKEACKFFQYYGAKVWSNLDLDGNGNVSQALATFRNQAEQPNGIYVSAPVADLISVKNDKLDKGAVMALPAKSLVYFGITSYNNCFVVVDAK